MNTKELKELKEEKAALSMIDTTKTGIQYIRYRKARGVMDKGGVCSCDDGQFDFYTVMEGEIVGYDAIPGTPVYKVTGPELAKIRSSSKWHWKSD